MPSLKKFSRHKIWVVTGAASGIGLNMAHKIASAGGVVWALDCNAQGLKDLELNGQREGWDLFTRSVDITHEDAVSKLIDEIIQTSKRIDVWINNAGIQQIASFTGIRKSDFDRVMQVNLYSVVQVCHKLVPIMENQGSGAILNMASVAGHVPAPFMSSYVTSKHAIVGFSKALQAEFELLKSPLRMAFASPGFVDTSIIAKGKSQGFPEWLSWMLSDSLSCAEEILSSFARGQNEIHPTLSGLVMRAAYNVMPRTTVRSSRVLLTKGFKDLLLNRFQVPR